MSVIDFNTEVGEDMKPYLEAFQRETNRFSMVLKTIADGEKQRALEYSRSDCKIKEEMAIFIMRQQTNILEVAEEAMKDSFYLAFQKAEKFNDLVAQKLIRRLNKEYVTALDKAKNPEIKL